MKEWKFCPICQSKNITLHEEIGTCNQCGHGFRVRIPEEIMSKYYDKQYWDNDKNRQGILTVEPDKQWEKWVNARLRLLESFHLLNHEHPENIHILEFGCAEGMLLYALKQKGYQVMGNDVCAIVNESMEELEINISRLPVEEFSKSNLKFDLIMSFHVLEHLRDPLEVMRSLANMLTPNGIMLMHVPVDDQELSNVDHFHFFSNDSCLELMKQFTTDIKSDFVMYPIRPDGAAMAATYIGTKK